jgi:GNAT superfamily N-acetyltransferase
VSILFREARREDVAGIVAMLADDILGKGRETADLAPYLAAFDAMQAETGNFIIVGEADGRLASTYQLTVISGLSLRAARRALLEGVRVHADFRGRGFGRLLLADAEARARAAGCSLIQFTTNKVRTDAHRFYERAGFTPSHIGFKRELPAEKDS